MINNINIYINLFTINFNKKNKRHQMDFVCCHHFGVKLHSTYHFCFSPFQVRVLIQKSLRFSSPIL